jgi:uncharacterized protein Yka (UPF0111/DUF47 family)
MIMETRELIEQQSKIIVSLTHTVEVLSMENSEQMRINRELHEQIIKAERVISEMHHCQNKLKDEIERTKKIVNIQSKVDEMYRVEDIVFDSISDLIQLGSRYTNGELTYDEAVLAGKRMMHMKITGEEMKLEGPEDDCGEDED